MNSKYKEKVQYEKIKQQKEFEEKKKKKKGTTENGEKNINF